MKKDKAEAWVAALRSGEYEQGYGKLSCEPNSAEPVRYCCLGVYAVINGFKCGSLKYLSREMIANGGFRSRSAVTKDSCSLATFNDSEFTFDEIADIIEEQWEEL